MLSFLLRRCLMQPAIVARYGCKFMLSAALLLTLTTQLLPAQTPTVAWTRKYNEFDLFEVGEDTKTPQLKTDAAGNVYTIFQVEGGSGSRGYKIIKYSPDGTLLWQKNGGGIGYASYITASTVDPYGNVYVTGFSIDEDRGTQFFLFKHNTSGEIAWRVVLESDFYSSEAIAVDDQGAVYVVGSARINGGDFATLKFNANGVQQWVRTYNGTGNQNDRAYTVAVDQADGYLYVAGISNESPTSSSRTLTLIKYDLSGFDEWRKSEIGGVNLPVVLTVDGQGSAFVAGSFGSGAEQYGFAVKYSFSGEQAWLKLLDGRGAGTARANDIAVDVAGNVYFNGTSNYYDEQDNEQESYYVTIKYNAAGATQWSREYNNDKLDNFYRQSTGKITVDGSGNVYLTGFVADTAGRQDYLTLKYDASGTQQWEQRYHNTANNGNDRATSIALDAAGNVLITGISFAADPLYNEVVTLKYSQQATPQPTTLRINNGGPTLTADGIAYSADAFYSSGSQAHHFAQREVAGTTRDVLYKDYRSASVDKGSFSYNIPVANGSYRVYLHFAEIYHNSARKRVFSVNLEGGSVELANLDIFAAAGGVNKMITRSYPVTVSDGVLNLSFTSSVGKAMISCLQVLPASSAAREGVEELAEETLSTVAVRPNPFTDRLTLQSGEQSGKAVVTVVDALGRTAYRQTHNLQTGQLEVNLSHLKAGVYVVRMQTEAGAIRTTRVVKR